MTANVNNKFFFMIMPPESNQTTFKYSVVGGQANFRGKCD